MRILSRRDTAVSLFSDTGECWAYDSRAAALRDLGASFIRREVGRVFRSTRYYVGPHGATPHTTHEASYVMRDDVGEPLTYEDFADLLPPVDPLHRYRWSRWFGTSWNGDGPVPGTGRRHGGHYHRRPQTQGDRRRNQFLGEEHEDGAPRVRAKRSSHNLPDSWDDLSREHERRTWKAYRRHQYRRVADLSGANEGLDRAETAFLEFLERDLDAHPARARPMARELVERAQRLVAGLNLTIQDLEAPLAGPAHDHDGI